MSVPAANDPKTAGSRGGESQVSTLTRREMDVMAVLWDLGSATVAEVNERLDDDLAYNTVLTILRILERKGLAGPREAGPARTATVRCWGGRKRAGRYSDAFGTRCSRVRPSCS